MDRETWVYNIDRFTPDYVKGLSGFMNCAEAHRKGHHLIEHDFNTNYTCWNLHGEIPSQVDNDTIVSDFNMDENFGNDDNHHDNLDEMLHDAKRCKKFTKLSLVVRLLDLKAKNNWSDGSFTTLLELLHEAFPEDNELPVTTYHSKKLTCPMGLAVERIHACQNDCILYRKDYKDLHECPVCLKQPGNDIDVYLRPLIDDMIDLWETGVEIYDAYKKERFQLFAMIYCTINDFPAYGFLKGYVKNRYRPEGSIIQGYAAEEVVQFCINYTDDVIDIGLPQPRHQDKVIGMSPSNVDTNVIQIGYRPRRVLQYQGYDINGYTFYTKKQDDK
nr:hypothetical protein [Tanacetum cinerariifolium]